MSSSESPVDRASGHSLEMAHILFVDIVAYSLLSTDVQESVLEKLQEAMRETDEFKRALGRSDLICLPTGDGLALVFFREPEAPVRCALQLTQALRLSPEIKLRMGIHTGPVYRRADINANLNVAGGGINVAQRVMDCGDAGHILVSKAAAEVLSQVGSWNQSLHDLGEAEVKHGLRVQLINLWTEDAGNRQRPTRLRVMRAKRVRRALAVTLSATVIAVTLSWWLIYGRKGHTLGKADTIVLADFTNTTGDAVFDDTLKIALSVALTQSPFLDVLSESKVATNLKLMSRPPGTPVIAEVARELCVRANSKAYIAGSISALGSEYVLGLKAINCHDGDVLVQEQAIAKTKESVLDALGGAASKLRGALGESLATVQKFNVPLDQATTSSLEALKARSIGVKTARAKGDTESIPFFKRAVDLDPNFALAYVDLGIAYTNLGQTTLAMDNLKKAYALRDRVSEKEKYDVVATYCYATGELHRAIQTYKLWAESYPRASSPRANLAVLYNQLGQYEKAVTESQESIRLDPNAASSYVNLAVNSLALNRPDEAKNAVEQAYERKLDSDLLHWTAYQLAFFKGDTTEMDRQVAWAAGKPGDEDLLLSFQSDTEAYYGRLVKARENTRRAVESAIRNDSRETAAMWRVQAALREMEFGNFELAKQELAAALALASSRDIKLLAALTLGRIGETHRAKLIAEELEKNDSSDAFLKGYWLPTIRAAIALVAKNPTKAAMFLEAAGPYELGGPQQFHVGPMYPVYIRGQAELAARNGPAAATEFQKILDHRGVVLNYPFGALAHLQLGRAYALHGDTAKARAAYQDFLTLWKDADADIPILKQAKAEYAKLQ